MNDPSSARSLSLVDFIKTFGVDQLPAWSESLVEDLGTPAPTPDSEPCGPVVARQDRSAIKATRKHQKARAAAKSARQARRRSRK